MEDKQIYTTAKSEEIKRKLKSISKSLKGIYENYQKSQKDKALNIKHTTPPVSSKSDQNLRISEEKKFKTEYVKVQKNEGLKMAPENLQLMVTLTLFILIIFVMFLGIYLPYANK